MNTDLAQARQRVENIRAHLPSSISAVALGVRSKAPYLIFEHYRRMAEKLKPPEPVYVRLKAPPGIGAVQTRSGQRTTIGEDRIVEMSAEDANCLIPDGWIKLAE